MEFQNIDYFIRLIDNILINYDLIKFESLKHGDKS